MGCFGFSSSSISSSSKPSSVNSSKKKPANSKFNGKPKLRIHTNRNSHAVELHKIPPPPVSDVSPGLSAEPPVHKKAFSPFSSVKKTNSMQQYRLSGLAARNSPKVNEDPQSLSRVSSDPSDGNVANAVNNNSRGINNNSPRPRHASSPKPLANNGPISLRLTQSLRTPNSRENEGTAQNGSSAPSSKSSNNSSTEPSPNAAKPDPAPASPPKSPVEATLFEQNAKRISELRTFTYMEMRIATRNFCVDQQIGVGGFGAVYRGFIKPTSPTSESKVELSGGHQLQQVVAIKKLDTKSLQGHKEWMMEVSLLGLFDHPNLVELVGYCAEGEKRLLVYEYMNNTSLDRFLFGTFRAPLDWYTRLKVALDTARGLAYLHEEVNPQVIYRDFKTSNILLDSKFHAKLSDFGLAREGPKGDETHVSTEVRGTAGYASPEYIITGHLTPKNDVWGFGVVILELLTGRPCLDKTRPTNEHNLVHYCRTYLNEPRKFHKIADPRFQGRFPPRGLQKLAELARWCLVADPHARPMMSEIVQVLSFLVTFREPGAPGGGDWGDEDVIARLQKR